MLLLLLSIILNSVAIFADDSDMRIVGGRPITIEERPFQITLYRTDIPHLKLPSCGGTILNHRWILTAAHCVRTIHPDDLYIRVGVDNLFISKKQIYKIERSIPHPYFTGVPARMTNDVALLMTKTDIKFSPSVQPIRVRTKRPKANTAAVVSGFGVTKAGNRQVSTILSGVTVKIVENKKCAKLLAEVSKGSLVLSTSHFCAADLAGGRDACQGDSGGPITIGKSLAGVVSWGIGCASPNVPAFYTDVSQYISWIAETMGIAPEP